MNLIQNVTHFIKERKDYTLKHRADIEKKLYAAKAGYLEFMEKAELYTAHAQTLQKTATRLEETLLSVDAKLTKDQDAAQRHDFK